MPTFWPTGTDCRMVLMEGSRKIAPLGVALEIDGDIAAGRHDLQLLFTGPGQSGLDEPGRQALTLVGRRHAGVGEDHAPGQALIVQHAGRRGGQREALLLGLVDGRHAVAVFRGTGWISTDTSAVLT
mmetsp:Transcript_36583/g.66410  ORF Transcript_36583/g.66410 Transcript_36583/m.66410 type:complete len:127 (-) Transcript_36583:1489-1869(-)